MSGEVGKVLGQKWKALSAEDKKPYEDRAAEEKKKYEKAKAQYEVENPKDKKKGATKKSKKPVTSDVCPIVPRGLVTLLTSTRRMTRNKCADSLCVISG